MDLYRGSTYRLALVGWRNFSWRRLVRVRRLFVFGIFHHFRSQPSSGFQSQAGGEAPAFTKRLPPLHGDRVKVHLVEVTYAPGESSSPHSHPCPVIGHVIEGNVRMRVKGARERTFGVGDSFYEPPDSVHIVSANASQVALQSLLPFSSAIAIPLFQWPYRASLPEIDGDRAGLVNGQSYGEPRSRWEGAWPGRAVNSA